MTFDLLLASNDDTADIETAKCESGHSFGDFIPKLAEVMFNIFSRNILSEINDKIQTGRKRGSSSQGAKKIRKLCSE